MLTGNEFFSTKKMVAPLHSGKTRIKSIYITTKLLQNPHAVPNLRPQNGHVGYALYSNCTKKKDIVTLTKRISDYSFKGLVDHARGLFDQMGQRDTVSWNVMIRCYIENNRITDARDLFDEMLEKNSVSWSSMIMAYAKERKTHIALKLFVVMPDKDVVSWTAIVTALSKDSRIEDAWHLFKQMPKPNSVSWSSIISGLQQNGFAAKTLDVFKEMLLVGVEPAPHSLTSALAASADLAMLSVSEQVYVQILKRGFDSNTHIGNSAISVFIKSGSYDNARRVFVVLPKPDLVTWNSMIMGYGQHGYGIEAIMFFHQMQKFHFLPDRISLLGVLHGCSHCGFVEEGKRYFRCMDMEYGVRPGPEHYAIMVDLFARAGLLKEAHEIILEVPFQPTPIFWRALLNGCRIWGDTELGVHAADQVLKLEPYNSSACLMAIDIYASAGRWEEVVEMRRLLSKKQPGKELGCSWVEIKGLTHIFTTRDESHPELDLIYLTLELLYCDITDYVSVLNVCRHRRAVVTITKNHISYNP